MSRREHHRLPLAGSWLHLALDLPEQPRAALVIAPALFHEAPRSHRLFSLLADALAALQVAVLRLDYRGCGDSGGADADFLPSRAIEDCRQAADFLRARTGQPPTLLGVRGGALIAAALAESLPFWAWQPVADGASLLAELDARERFELGYRLRFPFLGQVPQADPAVLMGQCLHPDFRLELGALPAPARTRLRLQPGEDGEDVLGLAPALSDWAGQLDFSGRFPLPAVRALATRMRERLVC